MLEFRDLEVAGVGKLQLRVGVKRRCELVVVPLFGSGRCKKV
jgi:hypothetical protein